MDRPFMAGGGDNRSGDAFKLRYLRRAVRGDYLLRLHYPGPASRQNAAGADGQRLCSSDCDGLSGSRNQPVCSGLHPARHSV